LGLEKPNSSLEPGETFFPNSGSDLDSDETFQISRNLGLNIDEIVCLLDSQLWPVCNKYSGKLRALSSTAADAVGGGEGEGRDFFSVTIGSRTKRPQFSHAGAVLTLGGDGTFRT
jgi:hypothetical protein